MTITPDAFDESHVVVTKVEVLAPGRPPRALTVTGGSVSIDADAALRRQCSIELHDPTGELTPDTAASLLAPYQNELRLARGIRRAAGTSRFVDLVGDASWDAGTHDGTVADGGLRLNPI